MGRRRAEGELQLASRSRPARVENSNSVKTLGRGVPSAAAGPIFARSPPVGVRGPVEVEIAVRKLMPKFRSPRGAQDAFFRL